MIQLEHISKRYVGPSGTVDALKDVSVHVEKGDIYGITVIALVILVQLLQMAGNRVSRRLREHR